MTHFPEISPGRRLRSEGGGSAPGPPPNGSLGGLGVEPPPPRFSPDELQVLALIVANTGITGELDAEWIHYAVGRSIFPTYETARMWFLEGPVSASGLDPTGALVGIFEEAFDSRASFHNSSDNTDLIRRPAFINSELPAWVMELSGVHANATRLATGETVMFAEPSSGAFVESRSAASISSGTKRVTCAPIVDSDGKVHLHYVYTPSTLTTRFCMHLVHNTTVSTWVVSSHPGIVAGFSIRDASGSELPVTERLAGALEAFGNEIRVVASFNGTTSFSLPPHSRRAEDTFTIHMRDSTSETPEINPVARLGDVLISRLQARRCSWRPSDWDDCLKDALDDILNDILRAIDNTVGGYLPVYFDMDFKSSISTAFAVDVSFCSDNIFSCPSIDPLNAELPLAYEATVCSDWGGSECIGDGAYCWVETPEDCMDGRLETMGSAHLFAAACPCSQTRQGVSHCNIATGLCQAGPSPFETSTALGGVCPSGRGTPASLEPPVLFATALSLTPSPPAPFFSTVLFETCFRKRDERSHRAFGPTVRNDDVPHCSNVEMFGVLERHGADGVPCLSRVPSNKFRGSISVPRGVLWDSTPRGQLAHDDALDTAGDPVRMRGGR